ncbi:hypothetical protein A9Q02_08965 [Candidatus Chloroploca asiatica]|uniref:Uncharacterized protein n=1 Tax=Candidatus Chloroploca asiatica TaxID=1506545 RepID=A0A2H3L2I5_9CHLR|nr:hypothetical protein A9Q02_08965 [Candidatus Chloroploca asiatica]
MLTAAAIAAYREILDILGTPKLRGHGYLHWLLNREHANLDTHGSREDIGNTGEDLMWMRVDLITNEDPCHPGM